MQLSIVVPAIRKELWEKFYNSLTESFHGKWELILIGPYEPSFRKDNMRWIEDWGNPTRCQQIGILEAKGEWICFGWDDAIFQNNALDEYYSKLSDYKTAISGKYMEGTQSGGYMLSEDYYKIKTHEQVQSPYVPQDFVIFNTGIVSTQLLKETGGMDCRFETTGLACLDLSIRLQLYGAKIIIGEGLLLTCTWLPGNEGDHEPVNKAFFQVDMPYYNRKYKTPEFKNETIIPLDNWKQSPERWERRFLNG